MELLKIWEDWAKKNGYTSLTQSGIIKTMVTEFCKHLESIPMQLPVKPANGDNKFQEFYLGEEVLLTIPMEKALENVAPERLSSKGIIKMIWLKLGKIAMYEVKLEREVLGERIMQTDGRILSRLSV